MSPPYALAPPPNGWSFHHLGYATRSIANELPHFAGLGYATAGPAIDDPRQGVTVQFLQGLGPRIELVQPLAGSTLLDPWLAAGIRLYHAAYEVPAFDEALQWAREQRARLVVPPVAASAFGSRTIAFVMLRNGFLVEFIAHEACP